MNQDTKLIRARILAVAEQEFRTRGYSQTTMDQLADLLGMSKRTLYEHFESKEKLAEGILKEISLRLTTIMRDTAKMEGNAIEKMLFAAETMQSASRALLSVQLLCDLSRHAPHLWQQMIDIRNDTGGKLWRSLLIEGKKNGHFRKDLDIDVFLYLFLGSSERLSDLDALVESGLSLPRIREGMIDVFVSTILTDKGRKAWNAHKSQAKKNRTTKRLPKA